MNEVLGKVEGFVDIDINVFYYIILMKCGAYRGRTCAINISIAGGAAGAPGASGGVTGLFFLSVEDLSGGGVEGRKYPRLEAPIPGGGCCGLVPLPAPPGCVGVYLVKVLPGVFPVIVRRADLVQLSGPSASSFFVFHVFKLL